MASSVPNRRSRLGATPDGATTDSDSLPTPSRLRRTAKAAAALTAAVGLATLSGTLIGQVPQLQGFLDFGAGVLALLALSGSVMWGLVSTDRRVLYPDHRLWTQRIHRLLAVAGLGFLVLHIWIKVARDSVLPAAALIPFADTTQPVLIGLGTLAGYVFVLVAVIGAARSRFTSPEGSLLWRAVHMAAYLAWGAALIHGLKAGREASPAVNLAYIAALVAVSMGLLLKLRNGDALTTRRLARKSPSLTTQQPASSGTTPRATPPQAATSQPDTAAADRPSRLTFERPRP